MIPGDVRAASSDGDSKQVFREENLPGIPASALPEDILAIAFGVKVGQ